MADAGLVAIALFEYFDDEEDMFLSILEELIRPRKNLEFPYWEYAHFNLERVAEDDCRVQFRFKTEDKGRLHLRIKSTRTRRLKWPPKRPELKLGPDLQSNL